jgi:L-fuculose-phosphate aldolase
MQLTEALMDEGFDPNQSRGDDPVLDLIRVGREAWIKGLVSGMSGNLSFRCAGHMLITCSGLCKGRLQRQDVIRVDLESQTALDPGRMSSEAGMHQAVYTLCPQAQAIVHVHPVYLLVLDQTGAELLDVDLFEAEQIRKELIHVPALPPGSEELAQAVAEAAASGRAVFMAKHGLTCWGEDLDQAVNLAEELEVLARIQVVSDVRRGKTSAVSSAFGNGSGM